MKKILNFKFEILNLNQAGFTLIELILYVVLVTMMLGTLIPFAWNVIEGSTKVTVEQEVYSQARYLSERIKKEIREASSVTTCNGTTLTLANPTSTKNPTTFSFASNAITITQGTAIPSALRLHSTDTGINSFNCTNNSGTNTNNVQATFTIASNYTNAVRNEYAESLNIQLSAETRSSSTTIAFDDAPGTNTQLNGQYPAGVIDWGTNLWWIAAPWGLFTTKSISFNGAGPTSQPFTFISAKKVVSIQAYNGGGASTTVSLACSGNTTVNQVVAPTTLATISTNWANTCTSVTVGSTNGWDTNFDNLVIQ